MRVTSFFMMVLSPITGSLCKSNWPDRPYRPANPTYWKCFVASVLTGLSLWQFGQAIHDVEVHFRGSEHLSGGDCVTIPTVAFFFRESDGNNVIMSSRPGGR